MPRVKLIQIRGGTAAAWTSANPVLALREMGMETDTRKHKFGDGVTAWNSLSYAFSGGASGPPFTRWTWSAHANAAPTATAEGQAWFTNEEYLDGEFFIPAWSLLISKSATSNSINPDPDISEFIIK